MGDEERIRSSSSNGRWAKYLWILLLILVAAKGARSTPTIYYSATPSPAVREVETNRGWRAAVRRWAAALLLLVLSIVLAGGALYERTERADFAPDLILLTDPQPSRTSFAPVIKATVTTTPGIFSCGLAHVEVVFDPSYYFFTRDEAWDGFRNGHESPLVKWSVAMATLDEPQNVHFSLDTRDAYGTFSRIGRYEAALIDPRNQNYMNKFQTDLDVNPIRPNEDVSTGRRGEKYLNYTGTIANWGVHHLPLRLDFDISWTRYRTLGSCFISTPRLLGDSISSATAIFGMQNHYNPKYNADQFMAGQSGATQLVVANGQAVPDPRYGSTGDPTGTSWQCATAAADDRFPPEQVIGSCGGGSIVERDNANNYRAGLTFLAAALVALAFQVAWESYKQR